MNTTQRIEGEIREQRKWIREHGGDLAGYVVRYGSKDDPKHYGDGGEAIYAADSGHLRKLEDRYSQLTRGRKVDEGQALLDDMRRSGDAQNDHNTREAVYLVEATHFEVHALWLEYSEEALAHGWGSADTRIRRVPWQQIGLGYGANIGTFGKMPVVVAVSFARIHGQVVAFYEATSQVVDYRMVEKWRGKQFPAARGRTNPMNFGHCLHDLEEHKS